MSASLKHERIVRLFEERPELAAELLRMLDVPLPAYTAPEIKAAEFTSIEPVEYRADKVVMLPNADPEGGYVQGIVVEVQLNIDQRKALHLAGLHGAASGPV